MDILSNKDKRVKRMLFWSLIISLFVFFGLISLVLSPIYTSLLLNRVYQFTLLPDVVHLLIQLLNLMAFAVCFSIIIYSIYKFQIASSAMLIVIYCTATFLKYSLNMVISSLMMRTLDVDEISGMMLGFILDVVIAMIVISIAHGVLKKYRVKNQLEAKANLVLNNAEKCEINVFSFTKFYCAKNPMQYIAMRIGILMAVLKVISRLIYDATTYGLIPMDATDLLWMLAYYTSDIICGLIIYGISLLTLKYLHRAENKLDN